MEGDPVLDRVKPREIIWVLVDPRHDSFSQGDCDYVLRPLRQECKHRQIFRQSQ